MIVRSVLDSFDPDNFDYFNDYTDTLCWVMGMQRHLKDPEPAVEVEHQLRKGWLRYVGATEEKT